MNEEKSRKEKITNRIVYALQILSSIIFCGILIYIQSIPTEYVIIAASILALLLIGEYFLIFYREPKSKRSIITQVISVLLSIVLILGSTYIYDFGKVTDLMGNSAFQSRAISVIVLEDSDILNEKQLENKKLGLITFMDKTSMDYAVDDINKNIGTVSTTDYSDFTALLEAFYNKEVDGIILDEAFREIATTNYDNFDDETRVVYQITKQESNVSATSVDVTENPFIVYISGNDEYGEIHEVSRTDVNMLVAVNPKTYQILLISIPRDTYYPLHTSGQYDKFTHSGIYGLEESQNTLEDMLGIDINYCVKMNFTSFMNIIDAIGGVDITIPEYETVNGDGTFTTKIYKYDMEPGLTHMDAKHALAFVRERKSFISGDFIRGQNQELMTKAVINKVCSPAILTSFSDVMTTVSESIQTNMSTSEINSLIQYQLSKMPNWDIQSYQIDGTPTKDVCYSLGNLKASVTVPLQESLDKTIEYLNQILNGETVVVESESNE
jgi:LCP family protein required for cell wall assembly